MSHDARFLIVSGPAAAGKTTIATKLANELDLPLISKNIIKSAMRSAIDPGAISARQLGDAAVAVLLSVARQMNKGAIIDNIWRRDQAEGLRNIRGLHVELFCFCERLLLEERYAARVRPAGYVSEQSSADDLWSTETLKPIGIASLINVDTAQPIDFTGLIKAVEKSWASNACVKPKDPAESSGPFEENRRKAMPISAAC